MSKYITRVLCKLFKILKLIIFFSSQKDVLIHSNCNQISYKLHKNGNEQDLNVKNETEWKKVSIKQNGCNLHSIDFCAFIVNTNPNFQHHCVDNASNYSDEVEHIPGILEEILWSKLMDIEKVKINNQYDAKLPKARLIELLHLDSLIFSWCNDIFKWDFIIIKFNHYTPIENIINCILLQLELAKEHMVLLIGIIEAYKSVFGLYTRFSFVTQIKWIRISRFIS